MSSSPIIVEGKVKPDGTLELDQKIALPPGRVRVIVEAAEPSPEVSLAPGTLAERFKSVIGIVRDLPPDLAEHHDHYLYGTPK